MSYFKKQVSKQTSASARHKLAIRGRAVKTVQQRRLLFQGMATMQVVYNYRDCLQVFGPSLVEVMCRQHLHGMRPTVSTDNS